MKYLLMLLLFCSCGQKQNYNIDPAFVKYFDEFMYHVQEHNLHPQPEVTANFVDKIDDNTIGYCQGTAIVIDKTKWESLTETKREILMFHELGHCLLLKHHNESLHSNYEPVSIMYPYLLTTDTFYTEHKAEYIQELFQ